MPSTLLDARVINNIVTNSSFYAPSRGPPKLVNKDSERNLLARAKRGEVCGKGRTNWIKLFGVNRV